MATAQEYDAKALLLQSQMDYLQADDDKCVEFLRVGSAAICAAKFINRSLFSPRNGTTLQR